jgi:hypothetical protein
MSGTNVREFTVMTPEQRATNKVRNQAYYAANREKELARMKAYRIANPELFRAREKARPPRPVEQTRATSAAYYRAHRAERIAAVQARVAAEPEKRRAWLEANRAAIRAQQNAHRATCRETTNAHKRAYDAAHPEARSFKAWAKAHPEKVSIRNLRRRVTKAQATPAWANAAAIAAIYTEAARLTRETGIKHHVDHYYPLKSPLVSGLHVEANLQILTAVQNLRKHNKHPDVSQTIAA